MGPEKASGAGILGEQLEPIGTDALDVPQAKASIDHRHKQVSPRLANARRGQRLGDKVGVRGIGEAGIGP